MNSYLPKTYFTKSCRYIPLVVFFFQKLTNTVEDLQYVCVYLFFTALRYKNASSKCIGLSCWHRRSETHIHPPYMNSGVYETKEMYIFTCKLYLRAMRFRRSCFSWRSRWWGLFFYSNSPNFDCCINVWRRKLLSGESIFSSLAFLQK